MATKKLTTFPPAEILKDTAFTPFFSSSFPDDEEDESEALDEEEPYEGIREDNDDNDLIDDNMSGMPVIPSPS